MMTPNETKLKPRLRGYIHQYAFFVSIVACALLIAKGKSKISITASCIYSLGLLLMFGISAGYHRLHWEPKARALVRRLDHSAIFLLIAGTFTPFCLITLPDASGRSLFIRVWSAAVIGIVQSLFWIKAPKWFTALLCVAVGWLLLPFLPELRAALGNASFFLILYGGLIYTLGAVFYALKRPNPIPGVFGYHELFHLCTVIAALFHFIVVFRIV